MNNDTPDSRLVSIWAGRRHGKTLAFLEELGANAARERCNILCVSQTLEQARVYWQYCAGLFRRCTIAHTALTIRLENGSIIRFVGAPSIMSHGFRGHRMDGIIFCGSFLGRQRADLMTELSPAFSQGAFMAEVGDIPA